MDMRITFRGKDRKMREKRRTRIASDNHRTFPTVSYTEAGSFSLRIVS